MEGDCNQSALRTCLSHQDANGLLPVTLAITPCNSLPGPGSRHLVWSRGFAALYFVYTSSAWVVDHFESAHHIVILPMFPILRIFYC